MTASEWKKQNPNSKGNIRDYADASQLVCLSNLESINAMLIKDGIPMETRIGKLNEIAIYQMNILLSDSRVENIDEEISLQENN